MLIVTTNIHSGRHKSIISVVKTLDNNIVLIIVQLTPLLIDYVRGC